MAFNKKDTSKNRDKVKKQSGGEIFIIEKDGYAYYKDKRLNLVCKKAKMCPDSPYKGYIWKYDYLGNLEWFKRYVTLITVNKGSVRFVGMTKEEFMELGGTSVEVSGVESLDIKSLSIDSVKGKKLK